MNIHTRKGFTYLHIIIDGLIKNEYDGRYSEGKIVRYFNSKAKFPTGTINFVTKDRKSMEILWHSTGKTEKILHSDGKTLEVLYSEYEIKNDIPEDEKYFIYFSEFPDLKDEDEDDGYLKYDHEYEYDEDYD